MNSDSNYELLRELEAAITPIPTDTLSTRRWSVAIIGAGPAGTAAAIMLSSRGHSVLLLDQHRFPREKVCGDGLIADAQRVLARIGLLQTVRQAANPVRNIRLLSPSGIEFNLPGDYLVLERRVLDALLLQRAVEYGADICVAKVVRRFATTCYPSILVRRLRLVKLTAPIE